MNPMIYPLLNAFMTPTKAKRSVSGARSAGQPSLRCLTFRALLLCMIVMNSAPASAQTKLPGVSDGNAPIRITGIYSNMAYSTQEGDVLGTEVFVVNTNRGYYVVFQSGDGEPTIPVVVPAEVSKSSIRFVLPPGVVGGTFTGTIGSNQLIGSFSSNHQVIRLKRKASYWQ
jgi:hypothetical protein